MSVYLSQTADRARLMGFPVNVLGLSTLSNRLTRTDGRWERERERERKRERENQLCARLLNPGERDFNARANTSRPPTQRFRFGRPTNRQTDRQTSLLRTIRVDQYALKCSDRSMKAQLPALSGIMTDKPINQPTDRLTDRPGHREV